MKEKEWQSEERKKNKQTFKKCQQIKKRMLKMAEKEEEEEEEKRKVNTVVETKITLLHGGFSPSSTHVFPTDHCDPDD